MIGAILEYINERVEVRVQDFNIYFRTSNSARFATIDGIKLDKAGSIKEFPDLKDREDWKEETIKRFKEKIKFESKSFEMIEIDENMMIYIDPPYGFVKDKSGEIGNKQISEAGYNNFYHQKDDLNLYQFCHKINEIGSSFMISGVLEHGGQTTWILDKLIFDNLVCYKILHYLI
jgi:site-specific DNA-adenine methylase